MASKHQPLHIQSLTIPAEDSKTISILFRQQNMSHTTNINIAVGFPVRTYDGQVRRKVHVEKHACKMPY